MCPCKGCAERHDLCHSDCEKSLDFKEKNEAEKTALLEERLINYTLAGLRRHRVNSRKKGGKH